MQIFGANLSSHWGSHFFSVAQKCWLILLLWVITESWIPEVPSRLRHSSPIWLLLVMNIKLRLTLIPSCICSAKYTNTKSLSMRRTVNHYYSRERKVRQNFDSNSTPFYSQLITTWFSLPLLFTLDLLPYMESDSTWDNSTYSWSTYSPCSMVTHLKQPLALCSAPKIAGLTTTITNVFHHRVLDQLYSWWHHTHTCA